MTTTLDRSAHPASIRAARTAVAASMVGSVLEYYDFFVFGTMSALVFGEVFFPVADAAVSAMLALAGFAVGFVARPVGGVLLGHFGDRIGRKPLLIFTFLLTGTVTVLIGVLPTYAAVGVFAPLLLICLRILQGIGIGGEWGGAALLAVEHAPAEKKGLYGSLVQAGAPIGVILSSGGVAVLTASMPHEQLLAWGWRIPFLASVLLLAVGLFLRMKVAETPEFEDVKRRDKGVKMPVWRVVRAYPRQIVAAIFVHTSDTTVGLIQGVFVLGYATGVLHMDPTIVLLGNIFSSVVNLAVTPIAGRVGDRIGPKRVVIIGAVGLALWAFPMFMLLNTATTAGVFVAMGMSGLLTGWLFSNQATLFASLFPANIRYSGMSLGFQIGTVLGGGFGPLIAQALTSNAGGATWPVSVYVAGVAVVALIAAMLMRPRFGTHEVAQ